LIERDVAFGAHELVEHGAHLGRHGGRFFGVESGTEVEKRGRGTLV
jgi:hypothetical protein|tara:strand:+ start:833 stop:970 length:138 start_codon:yes stop_codon:yes gene_type:complete